MSFLDLPSKVFQPKVVYQGILRQAYQHKSNELWFKFSHQYINFSLLDFALITGLLCHSNIDSASFVHGIERGRLRSEYFVAKKNIKRDDIKDTWRNNLKGKPNRRSSNDEMTVQRTSLENAFTMEGRK